MNIQTITNVSDCVPLYLPHSLYLKPCAKFIISVQLPPAVTGTTISNWDVMESLRNMISPDKFSVLKVTKSTLEVIRFDCELEDCQRLKPVLSILDGNVLKLCGYNELGRIRATETKVNFPKRQDWDSYFRDARNMDEKKPGERPDTIHISNLPIRWFCPRHKENEDNVKPSESIFKRIFEKFGPVRVVDIPICDRFRKKMKSHMSGMKTFSFDQELYFEGYVQFSDYIGFAKTMNELREMKLVRKEGDKNLAISISVDFDTTKHLSESSIKRRQTIRDRLIMKENAHREKERRIADEIKAKKDEERQKMEQLKLEKCVKQRLREEKRKEKYLKKIRKQEQQQFNTKIRSEEKKLLIAQRKLESMRVLEALFERIKLTNSTIKTKIKQEHDDRRKKSKTNKSASTSSSASASQKLKTFDLRNKLINKVKTVQEQELEPQKNRVKKFKAGTVLGTALEHSMDRSPSVNSISSDESILSDRKAAARKKIKKKSESDLPLGNEDKGETSNAMMPHSIGAYPMYSPETRQWINMSMGMGMYPYPAPFFQTAHMVRPEFFQNPIMPYSTGYRGNYRGRFPRNRGLGQYRGRGGYHSLNAGSSKNDYNDYDDSYDPRRRRDYRKRSNSRSRSRSRSHSYSSRSRSRSYYRNRRSRSRSSRNRNRNRKSRSKSRSKLQIEHKAKKLASTLRRSRSTSSGLSSRPQSQSRHSKRSSTRENRNRSHSHSSKHTSTKSHKTHKSIAHLKKQRASKSTTSLRNKFEHRTSKDHEDATKTHAPSRTPTNTRSQSFDSSAFLSPKRKAPSVTPEKEWN